MRLHPLAPLVLLLLAPVPAVAQRAILAVTVVDSATGAPLPEARLSVRGRARGSTDAAGVARVNGVRAGEGEAVLVERIGYAPKWAVVPVEPGENPVLVTLAAAPVAVRAVEVTARPTARSAEVEGFYQRKERGGTGYFLDRRLIERANPVRVTDLLRRVPNLQVTQEMDGTVRIGSMRAQAGPSPGAACRMEVFVDGFQDATLANGGEGAATLDRAIDPDILEGIEVYLGSTVPAQFGGVRAGRCGVVLIWIRDR